MLAIPPKITSTQLNIILHTPAATGSTHGPCTMPPPRHPFAWKSRLLRRHGRGSRRRPPSKVTGAETQQSVLGRSLRRSRYDPSTVFAETIHTTCRDPSCLREDLQDIDRDSGNPCVLLKNATQNSSKADPAIRAKYFPAKKWISVHGPRPQSNDDTEDGFALFLHNVEWPQVCKFLSGMSRTLGSDIPLHLELPSSGVSVVDPTLLGTLPSLRGLEVGNSKAAKEIIRYPSGPDEGDPSGWPCPNLERLALSPALPGDDDLVKAGNTLLSLRNSRRPGESARLHHNLAFDYDVEDCIPEDILD